jgi:hypothetical protein
MSANFQVLRLRFLLATALIAAMSFSFSPLATAQGTVPNEWTWIEGSSTIPECSYGPPYCGQIGVYGTLGTPAPGNIPAAELKQSALPTMRAIFGSLGVGATMARVAAASSTICGNSTLPQANGCGWAEAASLTTILIRACTAHWECLLPVTCREIAPTQPPGLTAMATSGFLGAEAHKPTGNRNGSTTFGSSIPRPWNGRGWAEAVRRATSRTVAMASPVCTAHWERPRLETYQDPARKL